MIVLVARYQVKPGKGGEVLEALSRMARLVKEQELGCTLYQGVRQRFVELPALCSGRRMRAHCTPEEAV